MRGNSCQVERHLETMERLPREAEPQEGRKVLEAWAA